MQCLRMQAALCASVLWWVKGRPVERMSVRHPE